MSHPAFGTRRTPEQVAVASVPPGTGSPQRWPAMSDRLPTISKARSGLPNLVDYLQPERLLRKHRDDITRATSLTLNYDNLIYSIRRKPSEREEIRQDLATLPSCRAFQDISDQLSSAVALTPDRRVIQAAVAVLFDSRVRGPQNPQIYLEALTYDLADEGFAPAVVVAACETLRRESTFTPEIAEVIAECRRKRANYSAVARLAGRMSGIRSQIEDAIAAADAEPPPAPRPPPRPGAQPGDPDWG